MVEADEHGETTGYRVNFRRLRDAFGGTYIANGEFDYAKARAYISRGDADLISFGRLFLANPDLPARLAQNAPLNTSDHKTFYEGGEKGYIDYPALEVNAACCCA